MSKPTTSPPKLADVALVFLGGALGAAGRALLDQGFPDNPATMPVTLWINLSGAFVLGFLLHAFARSRLPSGTIERLRLTIGTGLLGGFTTYSAFALGVADLWITGRVWAGLLYLGLTVIVGGVATLLGIRLADAIFKQRPPPPAPLEVN